jgi:peptide chain release factor 1
MRKTQIGSGDRNERIRTYNFPQNRCTDHRIEFTVYHLDAIMAGGLDEMIAPMRDHVKKQRLAAATTG